MAKKLTFEEVYEVQESLRSIESSLEKCGRDICDISGGAQSWNKINRALEELRGAIRDCHHMYA